MKQVKRAVECFDVVAQFVSARLNPKQRSGIEVCLNHAAIGTVTLGINRSHSTCCGLAKILHKSILNSEPTSFSGHY